MHVVNMNSVYILFDIHVFPTFFFIASKYFLPLHVKHRLKIGLFYPSQYQEGNESIVKIHSLFLHEQDPLHVPIECESMIDLPLPDCLKLESEYAVHWNFRSSPLFQVRLQHLDRKSTRLNSSHVS